MELLALLGWAEILIILVVMVVAVALLLGVVLLAVYLSRRPTGPVPPPLPSGAPPASTAPDTCRHCGSPVPAGAPEALCPRCVMEAGFEHTQAAQAEPAGARSPKGPAAPDCAELAVYFPQFEILELLGAGGMGAVYKARQRDLDRTIALKILPPETAGGDPAFARRFASEARALARINHPNIVAVHEFGQAGPFWFFVMEYVDGTTLRRAMGAHRLKPQEALAIVPQICDALQFAHDQGVVHRDVKPENILLDRAGRVKIADFGLARLLGAQLHGSQRLTATRDIMGTPQYMAPEQLEKPTEVDHRADIYSLGVVFYEMLTGELPLGRFPPPSRKVQVDVRLDDVVLRALEKEPELRYQQAGQVKTDVESISGAPGSPPTRTASWPDGQAAARKQLKIPAMGLVIASLLGPFMVGFLVTMGRLQAGEWMFLPLLVQLGLTALAAYGGLKAMRLESYRMAVTGGIAACVMSFLNLLCLPFAVWYLAVLTRPHVKSAFG